MMSNWKLFKRSLSKHPGIDVSVIWAFMVALALAKRPDFVMSVRVAIVWALLSLLPWIPVCWTAWTGRHWHRSEE
jgi:hypothetical protein